MKVKNGNNDNQNPHISLRLIFSLYSSMSFKKFCKKKADGLNKLPKKKSSAFHSELLQHAYGTSEILQCIF